MVYMKIHELYITFLTVITVKPHKLRTGLFPVDYKPASIVVPYEYYKRRNDLGKHIKQPHRFREKEHEKLRQTKTHGAARIRYTAISIVLLMLTLLFLKTSSLESVKLTVTPTMKPKTAARR